MWEIQPQFLPEVISQFPLKYWRPRCPVICDKAITEGIYLLNINSLVMQNTQKIPIHTFALRIHYKQICPSLPRAFPFTNGIERSQAFNPLDLYASVSTVAILSSHGFPGCSLCSSAASLSHLLTALFVCLHPLGWQPLLRFKTWLSAFLPQDSPYTKLCLHRLLKSIWTSFNLKLWSYL